MSLPVTQSVVCSYIVLTRLLPLRGYNARIPTARGHEVKTSRSCFVGMGLYGTSFLLFLFQRQGRRRCWE